MKLILLPICKRQYIISKEAVEGFIAKLDNTENAPDEKELSFLKMHPGSRASQGGFHGLLPYSKR